MHTLRTFKELKLMRLYPPSNRRERSSRTGNKRKSEQEYFSRSTNHVTKTAEFVAVIKRAHERRLRNPARVVNGGQDRIDIDLRFDKWRRVVHGFRVGQEPSFRTGSEEDASN